MGAVSVNTPNGLERRAGDAIVIDGGYQYAATHRGFAAQRFWHQKRMDVSLRESRINPGMKVLDIGCGSGVFADRMAAIGAEVTAVDANPRAVAFAQQTYRRPNLCFMLALDNQIDFPASSFDRITLLEVLEHMPRLQGLELLSSCVRLLRPGGLLTVSTPNAASLWRPLEWTIDRLGVAAHMKEDQHVVTYSPRKLKELAMEAGFTPVSARTIFLFSPWLAFISWSLAEHVFRLEQRSLKVGGFLVVQAFSRSRDLRDGGGPR